VAVPDCGGVVGLAELPKSKYNFKAWNTKIFVRWECSDQIQMNYPIEANIIKWHKLVEADNFTFTPADLA
jgi:hypothetical protein